MKIIGETPLRVPPRAIVVSHPKNIRIVPKSQTRRIVGTSRTSQIHRDDSLHPSLTTHQIVQIARIFDPTVEDDLTEARAAWKEFQSTRKRDAVYEYLTTTFQIVARWKEQHRSKAKSHQALKATDHRTTIRSLEPFAVVILCTSDPRIVDVKTRSKWSRALRYAEQFKPEAESLTNFIKSRGINECADRFSNRAK